MKTSFTSSAARSLFTCLLVALTSLSTAQVIDFSNNTTCAVSFDVIYRLGNCSSSTQISQCVSVSGPGSTAANVPAGYVFRGFQLYCGLGCSGTSVGSISTCTSGSTNFTCCGTTLNVEVRLSDGDTGGVSIN